MSLPKTIDEINRLFEELVRDPWSQRLRLPQRTGPARPGTGWEVEIPVTGSQRDDIAFSIEGRQVTVAVSRRKIRTASAAGAEVAQGHEETLRRSFTLPDGAELSAIEARFEGQTLRIRIALHEH